MFGGPPEFNVRGVIRLERPTAKSPVSGSSDFYIPAMNGLWFDILCGVKTHSYHGELKMYRRRLFTGKQSARFHAVPQSPPNHHVFRVTVKTQIRLTPISCQQKEINHPPNGYLTWECNGTRLFWNLENVNDHYLQVFHRNYWRNRWEVNEPEEER